MRWPCAREEDKHESNRLLPSWQALQHRRKEAPPSALLPSFLTFLLTRSI